MDRTNSNEFYIIFKCTDAKYAKELMNNGTIMFNTARRWAEIEKESGKGQGDLYEGVFASCDAQDLESIHYYKNKYEDVEVQCDGSLVYFKRSSVINMPAFCFFLLKQDLFEPANSKGHHTLKANIPEKYFEDFADGVSLDEVKSLKEEDQPSLVMISNMEKFIDMIKSKLISFGVNESQIIVQVISYKNKKIPFYCANESPYELFLKDKSFEYQAECRIVVNTRDKSILNKIIRKPFDVGPINEFSQISNNFIQNGVSLEVPEEVYEEINVNE